MAYGNNIKIDVATYNRSLVGALNNDNPLIPLLNKQFKDFQNISGQKGTKVKYDLPPTVDSVESLGISSPGGYTQKEVELIVDKPFSVPIGVDNLEKLFNFDETDMMTPISRAAVSTVGTYVGKTVAKNFVDNTYLTYGDGTDAINSFQSLNQAVMDFDDMGSSVAGDMCMIIPTTVSAQITGQGLSQFVTERNNDLAKDWYVASIGNVDVYHSNLLPRHEAGTVGKTDQTLTVVSINAAGNQLTLSGATADDADALKKGDVLTFQDISGQPNLRFLTYYGKVVTGQKVQVNVQADSAADPSGNVVVDISPALDASGDRDSNINTAVVAGMELKAKNSHTCGGYFSKSAFMLAMPNLGSTAQLESSSYTDKDGVSMRIYKKFFSESAKTMWVHQVAFGSQLPGRYAKRLAFPY